MFRLQNPVESGNELTGTCQVLNRGRFAQKLEFIENGRSVAVLVGGRNGVMRTLPVDGKITIDLEDTSQ